MKKIKLVTFSCLTFYMLNLKPPLNNDISTLNTHNNKLERFGLQNFHHRLLIKLLTFSHKIINEPEAPVELKRQLKSSDTSRVKTLRNQNNIITSFATNNKSGEQTFSYIFPRLINCTIINDIFIKFNFFKSRVVNNINLYIFKVSKIVSIFSP